MLKEKILALLSAKFPTERKEGLEHLALSLALVASDEEQANELVERMSAEAVSNRIKEWRKSVDGETSKAIETYRKNHPEPEPKQEPKQDPKPSEPPAPKSEPQGLTAEAVAKIVSEAVAKATQPLQTEISAMKGRETMAQRKSLLESELKGVPDAMGKMVMDGFTNRSFETDDAFNEYLNNTKAQINGFKQELANQGLKEFGGGPIVPKSDPNKVSAGAEAYIKEKAEGNGGLGGKKI